VRHLFLLLAASPALALAFACGDDDTAMPAAPPSPTCKPPARRADANVALASAFGDQALTQPVEIVRGPGNRFYVLEQKGFVKAIADGGGPATTALDLSKRITSGGEAGLLGVAFDPKFSENGFVYLHFDAPLDAPKAGVVFQSVIARFASRDGGATFDPASERRILVVDQPFANHNGGKIAFGPDGYLYIAFGDGGSAGDPFGNGQNKNVLLGKILRIDVAGGKEPYAIPADNPFAGGGGRGEVWAYGLRNPWKFSWDRATGDMWAADVGQNKFEEVDRIVKGGNYGWNVREGKHCFGADTCPTDGFVEPVVEYGRTDGLSVTGGYVYRGTKLPSLDGKYVYGDFGSGRIWAVDRDAQGRPAAKLLVESGLRVSTFAQDDAGEIYVADYVTGKVKQLVPGEGAPHDEAPSLLSETGCLDVRAPDKAPAGAIAYDVASPLWSDGATKDRWVFVGSGKVLVAADGDFDVPPGSIAVKTFTVAGKRVETRLFVRYEDSTWAGFSYEWNDAQTDAVLLPGGKTKPLSNGQVWAFPSPGECFACHTPIAGYTLGLEARQIDHDGQLARWQDVLATPIASGAFPVLAGADTPNASDEARARGYLHANCSMCHREGGGAGAATMDLRVDASLADTRACNAPPQAGDLGVQGAKVIAPGDPSRSILAHRMRATDDKRMPPLATSVVDEKGFAAVEAWIRSLGGCP
jgi:uncharacterized repeat protein (TIGR03806 family)